MDIKVCVGSACHLKGSYEVIGALEKLVEENKLDKKITIKGAFCLGHCTEGVAIQIEDGEIFSIDKEGVPQLIEQIMEGKIDEYFKL